MSTDRRSFLKRSALGLATASALGSTATLAAGDKQLPDKSLPPESLTAHGAIPAHKPLLLPGIHAYAQKSLSAGDTVQFRVSATAPYKLEICRLAGDVDDPKSDVVLGTIEQSTPVQRPIHPGSYVHVEKCLPTDAPLTAFSLECWVRPWRLKGEQGVISQLDLGGSFGVALLLDDKRRPVFYLGDEKLPKEPAAGAPQRLEGTELKHRRWSHIVGVYDGKSMTIYVNGRRVAMRDTVGAVQAGAASLRLGAIGVNGVADRFLEGDIAMPVIYSKALSADEVMARVEARGLTPPDMKDVLACWPLAEEGGDTIADISPHKRNGTIINHGAWMIGGPSFNGDQVGRYDTAYDPTKDAKRGHGLRFSSDDLFDCRWPVTHEWKVPDDAKSDVYVGRFHYEAGGKPLTYHVTFIVRRPESRPKAPVLVLCSSSTWMAYSATSFAAFVPPRSFWGTGQASGGVHAPGAPAWCCYRDHAAGQPTYYIGTKVPWPSAGPDVLYSTPQVGYSHLMRGELFTHRWLDGLYGDHAGYAYDVVTDQDLDADPKLLEGYKTIVINGHSEYWSAPEITGME
jgi:hypothetical protein